MHNLIQVPSQVVDFRPRADRSYKISFETRELSGKEVAVLADSYRGEGWLIFKPNGSISAEEIPKDMAEAGTKSQSQRLRSVIFILWKQKGEKGDFETYYRTMLEQLIDIVKERLESE